MQTDIYKYFVLSDAEIYEIEQLEHEAQIEQEEQMSKKSQIKLDKKIVLVPATEAIENISIPVIEKQPTPSPIPKKRTIKKRPKLILVESSDENKVIPENSIDPTAEKIFNPLTNRHVKNTSANRKKIEKQTLKRGGKSKKRTRKN